MLYLLSALTTMPTTTTTTTATASSPTSPPHYKPKKPTTTSSTTATLCKHSPSATLDLLILILVLFSCAFLITSSLSYIFHSLSQLLPQSSPFPLPYLLGFVAFFFVASVAAFCEICGGCGRSRRCSNPNCKGLKKAMEFDIQLQTEDCLKTTVAKEIDELPWKGGTEGNPDYECLRSELRKMAPPSGRAVLLFRARCGCPVAKLEAWGNKRGRRHKKALSVLDGGGAHR